MKSRINGKAKIIDDNKNEKNRKTILKNCFNLLLDVMEKDGNLSLNRVKRMIEICYSDDIFKLADGIDMKSALKRYSDVREYVIERLNQAKGISDYKKFLAENIHLLDLSRFVSAMFVEIASLDDDETSLNYALMKRYLAGFPMKDLISYNLNLEKNDEPDEEKRKNKLKEEFKSSPLIAVYATTTSDEVEENIKALEKVWKIDELIKVQKPEDVLEFGVTDEAKFKLAYINILYSYVIFEIMPLYENNKWKESSSEIHTDEDGYLVESSAIQGILTPSLVSTDKLLLTSGYRALECLENKKAPISEDKLILMCIEIEKAIKNKKIELRNKFDVDKFQKIVNSDPKIIQKKILRNELSQDDIISLYIEGKTTYAILTEYVDKDKLSESISAEQVVEEYKKFKKNEKSNAARFFRIAKLYRDNRIRYKNEKGDILDDEYSTLKEGLSKYNGNIGIIDFLKMGIFDVSAVIGFGDEKVIKEAFFAGAFSKSDVATILDFEILKERELKSELEQLPKSSLKNFLENNIEETNQNPKRRFIYSIDSEARSINAGEGFEIFFVNDNAIIIDTLNKNPNSGNSTIILGLSDFEEEFGLGGINSSKLFNKKASGEISINKLAKQKCSQKGVSFGFSQNWSDVMMQSLVGDEEERQSKYSEEDLAEQRKVIKLLNESLQK